MLSGSAKSRAMYDLCPETGATRSTPPPRYSSVTKMAPLGDVPNRPASECHWQRFQLGGWGLRCCFQSLRHISGRSLPPIGALPTTAQCFDVAFLRADLRSVSSSAFQLESRAACPFGTASDMPVEFSAGFRKTLSSPCVHWSLERIVCAVELDNSARIRGWQSAIGQRLAVRSEGFRRALKKKRTSHPRGGVGTAWWVQAKGLWSEQFQRWPFAE